MHKLNKNAGMIV